MQVVSSEYRSETLLNIFPDMGKYPQQRIIWAKMSRVLRLRITYRGYRGWTVLAAVQKMNCMGRRGRGMET